MSSSSAAWVTWLAAPAVVVPAGLSAAVAVAVGVIAALIAADYALRRWIGGDVCRIPSAPPMPLIGTAYTVPKNRSDTEHFLAAVVRQYDYTNRGMIVGWIGYLPNISLMDAELIKEVMSTSKHSEKSFVYRMSLQKWLGEGLLISSGDKWHTRRRMITPTFHFEILQQFAVIMNEHADVLVKHLDKVADGKQIVDIFEYITRAALDIICETAMGIHLNAQDASKENEYVAAVYNASRMIVERAERPLYLIDALYYNIDHGKRMLATVKTLHDFTDSVIRERRAALNKGSANGDAKTSRRVAFLDMLLTARDDENQPLSDSDIREEVDTFLFEGHDTTSASMAWTLYLIAMNPEVQQRLHKEVDQYLGDLEAFTLEDLKHLDLLERVTKESLRMRPSVPAIGRQLTEDAVIGGYSLKKGQSVILSIWRLHRNPKYWPNPDTFDPDRWLPENSVDRHPYAYVPFSAGPRNCIGQKFAQSEEKIVLAKILQRFSLTPTSADPIPTLPELILRPKGGVPVRLTRRRS